MIKEKPYGERGAVWGLFSRPLDKEKEKRVGDFVF